MFWNRVLGNNLGVIGNGIYYKYNIIYIYIFVKGYGFFLVSWVKLLLVLVNKYK